MNPLDPVLDIPGYIAEDFGQGTDLLSRALSADYSESRFGQADRLADILMGGLITIGSPVSGAERALLEGPIVENLESFGVGRGKAGYQASMLAASLLFPMMGARAINPGSVAAALRLPKSMKGAVGDDTKRRMKEMGMDFENLPGDPKGNPARARPEDVEPETVDPETARKNLKDKGFDAP